MLFFLKRMAVIEIATVAKIVAVAIVGSGVKIEVFCVSFEREAGCENSTEYWYVVGVGPCPSIPPVTKKGSMRKCNIRLYRSQSATPLHYKKDKLVRSPGFKPKRVQVHVSNRFARALSTPRRNLLFVCLLMICVF